MTNGIRALHVHSGNIYGGIETILVTLAHVRAASPQVTHAFALCYEDRLARELGAQDAPMWFLGPARFSKPWTVTAARKHLETHLKTRPAQVAICHGPWAIAMFGPTLQQAGLPVVFWQHGPLSGAHWLQRLARRFAPDFVICNSEHTAKSLARLYPNTQHAVLYAPVAKPSAGPGASRDAARTWLGVGPGSTLMLQASRMEAWKGHRVLLEALGRLRHLPEWVCCMAGGAATRAERRYLTGLKRDATRLAIADRVRFLGHRRDIPSLLAAADLYCQPNTEPEPFGIAFVEALYSGVPVVSAGIGGPMEIVTDACGVLVPPGDAPALAAVLEALIADPARRKRLGAAGPARASELCDPAQQIRKLAEMLRSVGGG